MAGFGSRRVMWALVLVVVAMLALSVTWMVTSSVLVAATQTQRTFESTAFADTRLLDEVLTMSARMAAQTGDEYWIDRYGKAEAQLASRIAQAEAESSGSALDEFLQTEAANADLVTMEHRAIALATSGDLVGARAVLAGPEYARAKAEYANSIDRAQTAYRQDMADDVTRIRWMLAGQLVITVIGAMLLFIVLMIAVRATRRWATLEVEQREREAASTRINLRELAGSTTEGLIVTDLNGEVLWANPAARDYVGSMAHLGSILIAPTSRTAEVRIQRTSGGPGFGGVSSDRITWDGSDAILVTIRDITEAKHLAQRAQHDALTGLANRDLLNDRLEKALAGLRSVGGSLVVMFVDVDKFKAINDTHGHNAGDQVLKVIADRLVESVRPHDTVARIGGDEFAVLCEDLPDEAVDVFTSRVLAHVMEGFTLDGVDIPIGISIGLVIAEEGHLTSADLLARADEAMYSCKAAGGRNFQRA